MTTPHPNADMLRAIADGKQMQGRLTADDCDWFDIYPDQAIGAIASDYSMNVRIKPETVLINGIECPAPMRVAPALKTTYFKPDPDWGKMYDICTWRDHDLDHSRFSLGLCFATADDAAAAARAMIEPLKLKGDEAGAALSTAAQPPAGFVLVPIELAQRVQETMGEFLMDHGWRQQDMDTSDEFDALLAVATKAAAAPASVARPSEDAVNRAGLYLARKHAVYLSRESVRELLAEAAPPAAQEDALDAARYRWLRERWGHLCESYEDDSGRIVGKMRCDAVEGWDVDPASLDAAIDAARGAQGESNG